MIVYKFLIVIYAFFATSWGNNEAAAQKQVDVYQIIEKVNYGENGLYYKTLSHDQVPLNRKFTYDWINESNVQFNSLTEKGRFVNFDTIFNPQQRKEIDYRLKNLSTVKLKRSKLSNPRILSSERTVWHSN